AAADRRVGEPAHGVAVRVLSSRRRRRVAALAVSVLARRRRSLRVGSRAGGHVPGLPPALGAGRRAALLSVPVRLERRRRARPRAPLLAVLRPDGDRRTRALALR